MKVRLALLVFLLATAVAPAATWKQAYSRGRKALAGDDAAAAQAHATEAWKQIREAGPRDPRYLKTLILLGKARQATGDREGAARAFARARGAAVLTRGRGDALARKLARRAQALSRRPPIQIGESDTAADRAALRQVAPGVLAREFPREGSPDPSLGARLYLPATPRPAMGFPAVILSPTPDPGGGTIGLPSRDLDFPIRLASAGVAVLLHSVTSTPEDTASSAHPDALAALARLRAEVPEVDRTRIFVLGAGSPMEGPYQLAAGAGDRIAGCLALWPGSGEWAVLGRVTAPLHLATSEDEPDASPAQLAELATRLRTNGRQVELKVLPEASGDDDDERGVPWILEVLLGIPDGKPDANSMQAPEAELQVAPESRDSERLAPSPGRQGPARKKSSRARQSAPAAAPAAAPPGAGGFSGEALEDLELEEDDGYDPEDPDGGTGTTGYSGDDL